LKQKVEGAYGIGVGISVFVFSVIVSSGVFDEFDFYMQDSAAHA